MEPPLVPRLALRSLLEALQDSPVVLIHGPRQSGKTTLARQVGSKHAYAYYSFDDDNVRASAQADPVGFIADLPDRVIIDEVQRLPELFTSLKATIDERRSPGRFLLTGSANILKMPALADSLAGRMDVIRLLPLSQIELSDKTPWLLNAIHTSTMPQLTAERLGIRLAETITAGGYPAALARSTPQRRATWYRNYVDALVQRDVQDLANIAHLDLLPRLLEMTASQTARLLNVAELSGPFQVTRPTIDGYMTLLGRLFLVDEQPAWHSNRLSRLIKSPKLHISDTGLGTALMRLDAANLYEDRRLMGQLLETFIYQELRKQALAHPGETGFHHFRDRDQFEVDIVVEFDGRRIGGIEVKASSTITDGDFRGLRKLANNLGNTFTTGIVLYDGEHILPFADNMYAVPISSIW